MCLHPWSKPYPAGTVWPNENKNYGDTVYYGDKQAHSMLKNAKLTVIHAIHVNFLKCIQNFIYQLYLLHIKVIILNMRHKKSNLG